LRHALPAIALLLLLTTAPAWGVVQLSDTSFQLVSWALEANPTSLGVSRETVGGNPGAYRKSRSGDGTPIQAVHTYVEQSFNPAVHGAISSFDISIDVSGLGSNSTLYRFIIRQGGSLYLGSFAGNSLSTTSGSAQWQTFAATKVTATQFTRLQGSGGAQPDFSPGGASITFGVLATNTRNFSAGEVIYGMDNFLVTIDNVVACKPFTDVPVNFFDDTFAPANWELVVSILGGVDGAAGQVATGGAPGGTGPYRLVEHNVAQAATALGSAVYTFHRKAGATYTPSTQGAIQSIEYCEMAKLFAPTVAIGQGQAFGPALLQGGKMYIFRTAFTYIPQVWTSYTLNSLTAANFYELKTSAQVAAGAAIVDNTSHPNFSSSGGAIQFGFYRGNSTPSTGYKNAFGIDNWALAVYNASSGGGVFSTLSGASYAGGASAPDSFVAGFGSNLAPALQVAAPPYPTELQGVRVILVDATGVSHMASLVFVAPSQINFIVPTGMAPGPATVKVVANAGSSNPNTVAGGLITISAVAPGVFSANANGQGPAAAGVLIVDANGVQTAGLSFQCAAGCVNVPIDLGPPTHQVYLTLYATGLRNRTSLNNVQVTIDGIAVPVLYGGEQGEFPALDQLNVGPIPRSLAGKKDVPVEVTVDGIQANLVTLSFQ
jgi:uncharacterized protein (TIGR03437 family)